MFIARSFLLLPALAVLAATLGGCESAIQVFPELFDQHELDYFRTHMIAVVQDDEDEIDPTSDTTYSIIKADPGFAERVHQATNTVGTSDAEINSRFLFSKVLRKSTDIHQDFSLVDKDTLKIKDSCDVHKDGPVEDKVGFVFMNDNPDATFVYGEEKVSVEAGKLVVFDGIVPHNTIVNRGTVQLAGPFQLRSFLTVGPELCDADELCCRGADRRLEEGTPEAEPASSHTRGADHRRKRRALEEIRDLREAYVSCETPGPGFCNGTCEPFCPANSLPPCGTKGKNQIACLAFFGNLNRV